MLSSVWAFVGWVVMFGAGIKSDYTVARSSGTARGLKSDDASSIMAAGQLRMTYVITRIHEWQETRKALAQIPVNFISTLNLSLLTSEYSADLNNYKIVKKVNILSQGRRIIVCQGNGQLSNRGFKR